MDPQLEAFVRAEHPRLVAALVVLVGDVATAEDLAQEALARAIDRWSRVRDLDSPGGWLHHVAVNLARSRWRRLRAARRAAIQLHCDHYVDVDLDEAMTLRSELAMLPARQREALIWRHVVGMSPHETASVLGCSPQAVRNLTHRATATLRTRMSDRSAI